MKYLVYPVLFLLLCIVATIIYIMMFGAILGGVIWHMKVTKEIDEWIKDFFRYESTKYRWTENSLTTDIWYSRSAYHRVWDLCFNGAWDIKNGKYSYQS